ELGLMLSGIRYKKYDTLPLSRRQSLFLHLWFHERPCDSVVARTSSKRKFFRRVLESNLREPIKSKDILQTLSSRDTRLFTPIQNGFKSISIKSSKNLPKYRQFASNRLQFSPATYHNFEQM